MAFGSASADAAGFRLTEKGRRAHIQAERLLAAVEPFGSEMGELRGELVGELTVAVIDNWVTDDRCPLVPALRRLGPDIRLNLLSLAPDAIEQMVLGGRARIGVGVFHCRKPGLLYEPLYEDPLELYCAVGHSAFVDVRAGRPPRDLQLLDYARRDYLSEEMASEITATLPSTARGHQVESIAYLILTGDHVGYLPVSYAKAWVEAGRMASVLPERFRTMTRIEIVTRRGGALPLLDRTFLDPLRQHTPADS